ncbi:hypothetical protein VXL90_11980 [Phaeobacter sp. JH41b]
MCSLGVQRRNLSPNVNPLRELAIAGINFASGILDGRSLNACAKEAILRCRKTVSACACSANSKGLKWARNQISPLAVRTASAKCANVSGLADTLTNQALGLFGE